MGARPDDYDIARSHELEHSLDRDFERERRFLRRDFRRRLTGLAGTAAVDPIHLSPATPTNEEP